MAQKPQFSTWRTTRNLARWPCSGTHLLLTTPPFFNTMTKFQCSHSWEFFSQYIVYNVSISYGTRQTAQQKWCPSFKKKTAYTGRNSIMYWTIQQITGMVTAQRMSQNYAFSTLHETMMYFIFFSVMKSPRTDYVIAKKWYFVNYGHCICFTAKKKAVWTFSICVFTVVVIIAILKSL